MQNAERRAELGRFLRVRRERLSPHEVGLAVGTRRRTPGLRREEVAQLAGVGIAWYTWLEQGRDIRVSSEVVASIARTLQLDAVATEYLHVLSHGVMPVVRYPAPETVSESLQQVLDALDPYPACVINPCWDVLAWNVACRLVFGDYPVMQGRERNTIWRLFTDPYMKALVHEWEDVVRKAVAIFRFNTQKYVGETWFETFVTELSTQSPEFAALWQAQEIQMKHDERKILIHPQVGRLVIRPTTLQVVENPDLRIIVDMPLPEENTAQKLIDLVANRTRPTN